MVLCWMWLINIVFLQLPVKEGFRFIRVISHESVIYVTGHVSHELKARHKASFLASRDSQKHFTLGNAGVLSPLLG